MENVVGNVACLAFPTIGRVDDPAGSRMLPVLIIGRWYFDHESVAKIGYSAGAQA